MRICIDAGHGGKDPGAVNGNLIEKNMTLITAKACASALERCGLEVILTRKADAYLSIQERADIVNQSKADACVSIHYNAGGGDRGEVIHSIFVGKGLALAKAINEELKSAGQTVVREFSKVNSTGKADYFGMIRDTTMPAVIVEPCFIDNALDRKLADSEASQVMIGEAIACGICKAFSIAWQNGTKIRVDGKIIHVDATLIAGQNYIKLKDLAKAGFKVLYTDMPELRTK